MISSDRPTDTYLLWPFPGDAKAAQSMEYDHLTAIGGYSDEAAKRIADPNSIEMITRQEARFQKALRVCGNTFLAVRGQNTIDGRLRGFAEYGHWTHESHAPFERGFQSLLQKTLGHSALNALGRPMAIHSLYVAKELDAVEQYDVKKELVKVAMRVSDLHKKDLYVPVNGNDQLGNVVLDLGFISTGKTAEVEDGEDVRLYTLPAAH